MITSYLLKVVAIHLAGYVVYRYLLEDTRLFHLRRWYLLICPLLAFVVPLTTVRTVVLPGSAFSWDALPVVAVEVATASPALSLVAVLLSGLYLAGLLIGGFRLIRNLVVIRQQQRNAVTSYRQGEVTWYGLRETVAVHSFGRSIFYCAAVELPPEVRSHELAHVRQWHTADRLLIRLLRIVCWFNPVLRLYERAIIHNHELLADAEVLTVLGLSPEAYQRSLLSFLTDQQRGSPISSYLPFSFTKNRFLMLQHPDLSRLQKAARLGAVGAVWLVLLLAFGQTVYAQQPPPPPPTAGPPPSPAPVPPPPPPVPAGDKDTPCPPPPPPLGSNSEYLDYTYAEFVASWTAEQKAKYPDCEIVPMYSGIAPSTIIRDYLIGVQESRLIRLTKELNPITEAEYASFQDPKVYGIWLDGSRIANAALSGRRRSELYSIYEPFLLYANAKDYGKYTYHLDLTSREELDREVIRLKAELATLRAGK